MALPFVTDLRQADFLSGCLLLIDKPKGWTSFDVVNKVRGQLRHKYNVNKIKVGHSGTLDPMATGLLLICTGKWTTELTQLTGLDKKYTGHITLGASTDSYDAEGVIVEEKEVPPLSETEMINYLKPFIGDYEQYPPTFSAIKKDGVPLYKLARAGKEVKTEPRKVKVYDLQLMDYAPPILQVSVHCGSGFYVRSLAHDLGQAIGCGAHLSSLTRTHVGEYSLDDAMSVEEIVAGLGE